MHMVTFPWTKRRGVIASIMDYEIDTIGMLCPLPVLKARKKLKSMQIGEVLRVLADDPAAQIDFPHFCNEQGHELVGVDETALPVRGYLMRKGA